MQALKINSLFKNTLQSSYSSLDYMSILKQILILEHIYTLKASYTKLFKKKKNYYSVLVQNNLYYF